MQSKLKLSKLNQDTACFVKSAFRNIVLNKMPILKKHSVQFTTARAIALTVFLNKYEISGKLRNNVMLDMRRKAWLIHTPPRLTYLWRPIALIPGNKKHCLADVAFSRHKKVPSHPLAS